MGQLIGDNSQTPKHASQLGYDSILCPALFNIQAFVSRYSGAGSLSLIYRGLASAQVSLLGW